jgi:hypothetical protein
VAGQKVLCDVKECEYLACPPDLGMGEPAVAVQLGQRGQYDLYSTLIAWEIRLALASNI